MALVAEDGTGKADAESYLTLAAFKAYCDARGLDYSGKTDPQIEQALRIATAYLDNVYGPAFSGERLNGRDQALEWPRNGATDKAGAEIDAASLPPEITSAAAEAAYRQLTVTGGLAPDAKPGSPVLKRIKAGSTELEYALSGASVTTFPAIDNALSRLIGVRSAWPFAIV